jgi:predicted metalloprotease with PDZ domain
VRAPAAEPYSVEVTARCEGGTFTGFRANGPALGRFVRTRLAGEVARDARFAVEQKNGAVELSYRVDLDAMARAFDDIDVARRFGDSLLAPASSFLLTPDPEPNGAPAEVRFVSPGMLVTGLRRGPTGFAIETHELRVATYTAFGAREFRSFAVNGMNVKVARLDGALDLPFETLESWVEASTRAVVEFYGRPPDREISVMLAPLPARSGIPFGKLLPESGPGVVVLVGEHTSEAELYADWVLVHELFHVGFPSFQREGKWLDEGLATYFEPIIRARAGFTREVDVWAEFTESMHQGLGAMTERGLEHARDFRDLYWGGALFCLLADVEIRTRSAGRLGLEDGLRAILAGGGNASEVWPLSRAIAVADRVFGAPVLASLAERHARRASPLDLAGLFQKLGVSRDPGGAVHFDDGAPLASVRRALIGAGRSGPRAP